MTATRTQAPTASFETDGYYPERELVVSRTFDAPREVVWAAWTDPEQVVQWWGPTGFTTTTAGEMQVRPGGVWRFTMHGPDGTDFPNRVVFKEVEPPQRLVFHHDDGGEAVEPVSFLTEVKFEGIGGKTKVTLRQIYPSKQERDRVAREYGAVEGGLQTVGRLAAFLAERHGGKEAALAIAVPTELEVILQREFRAPRRLVFEAMSRPEHMRNWWGPLEMENVICEMDFRTGGSWRIVQREADGTEHPFRGEYLEIGPPERIVQSFIYDVEGARDYPATETITLHEEGGRTLLTNLVRHSDTHSRDAHLHGGMEWGATQSMDRLEALLATLA